MAIDLDVILEFTLKKAISDVHLQQGRAPAFRVNSSLVSQKGAIPLSREDMTAFLDKLITDDRKRKIFSETGSVDVGYSLRNVARFRFNIFRQYQGISLVGRVIPKRIPNFRELSLPPAVEKIAQERRGLVLVTGTTGSGKSTTLASMLDYVNQTRPSHILTIEDPVEFQFEGRMSMINQREIGDSADNFPSALRAALRQDPDIILIGELRDTETIETALQAAETGHLVLSTMHTIDTVETIDRAVAVFPPHAQDQIRHLVAEVISWVVSMRLLPRKDGSGRVPACEILSATPRIRELIHEKAGRQAILEVVAKGHKIYGMQTFDQSLLKLYASETISMETALENCSNPADFKLRISGIAGAEDADYQDFMKGDAKKKTSR
ncbi:MAG: PilT/PilU family type 4a pilus ATPase [Pseudomonadota bacterium]